MSGRQAAEGQGDEEDLEVGTGAESDVEQRARRMGWKPKDEYRGPADRWSSAEDFIARGESELPIVRERYRTLERNMQRVEHKLQESQGVILDLTNRFHSADERAYKRARAELLQERKKAVELGDTEAFSRADAEIAELDREAPKAPPKPAEQPAAAANEPHPDTVAWGRRNPWFNEHRDLQAAAMSVHQGILQAEPGLSIAENLERVTQAMAALYPDRVRLPGAGNPRRDEPSSVSGSTAPAARGRRENTRTFEAMPKESRDAFTRYARQLEGKGKALTKEEWARDYWSQFEEA